jgi:hypothetical protein
MAFEEIERLLARDEAELLEEIGSILAGKPILPPSPAEIRRAAAVWLMAKRAAFADVICSNQEIRKRFEDGSKSGRRLEVAAAVADAIVGLCGVVPPATVSVLLVREGLQALCASCWVADQ